MINIRSVRFFLMLYLAGMAWASICLGDDASAEPEWLDQQMSLECGDRTMHEILQEVSASLKIEILYDAKLADTRMECSYTSTNIETLLKRLFRDHNKGLLFDPEKRMVTVQVFDVVQYAVSSESRGGEILDLPLLGKMTNQELADMQNLQYDAYQKELEDPESVVQGIEITRKELIALHRTQYEEGQRQINDPEDVVPGVEITRGELNRLHEQQIEEYQRARASGNEQDNAEP